MRRFVLSTASLLMAAAAVVPARVAAAGTDEIDDLLRTRRTRDEAPAPVTTPEPARAPAPPPRRDPVVAAPEAHDDENPLVARAIARERAELARRWWVSLSLGGGAGIAGNGTLEAHPQTNSPAAGFTTQGGAFAAPELGYRLRPTLAVALTMRLQYIPRDNPQMATGATAVLARALWSPWRGAVRPYGALSLGAGDGVRLLVAARDSSGTFRDTVRGGPLLAGAALGVAIPFASTWTWVVEAGTLAGAPRFAVAFDASTGLRLSF